MPSCSIIALVCVMGEIKKKTRFETTPTLALLVECFAVMTEINNKTGFERVPSCSIIALVCVVCEIKKKTRFERKPIFSIIVFVVECFAVMGEMKEENKI